MKRSTIAYVIGVPCCVIGILAVVTSHLGNASTETIVFYATYGVVMLMLGAWAIGLGMAD